MRKSTDREYFVSFLDERPDIALLVPYGDGGCLNHKDISYWARIDPDSVWPGTKARCDEATQTDVPCPESSSNKPLTTEEKSAKMRELVCRRWEAVRSQREKKAQAGRFLQSKSEIVRPSRNAASVQTSFTPSICQSTTLPSTSSKVRLRTSFLLECWHNLETKKPSYSTEFYDIAMILYLTSAKAYRLLRQIVQMPAISTLNRKYREKMRSVRKSILETASIEDTIAKIRARVADLGKEGKSVNAKFTLAVDAFSFRSFPGNPCNRLMRSRPVRRQQLTLAESEMEYSNGFLFLLISHDYRLPVQLVHLSAQKTGSYTREIDQIAHLIRDKATESKLRIWYRATDGDPGVAEDHNQFYTKHVSGKSSLFMRLVTDVHDWLSESFSNWIPISDPLHILKNVRARLLKHQIRLFHFSKCVDIAAMTEVLNLGSPLTDKSQIGKMRDCYVLSLFTFENVVKLLQSRQYLNACFLLPFASWVAVIFSDRINLGLRLFLVELSFQMLSDWFSEFASLNQVGVSQKAGKGKTEIVFSESQYVKRMLNTLVAFGVALQFGCENIRLDSLGTHLVENAIGIARATSSDPRFERIVSTYTRAELRKEIAAKRNFTIHIPGRINDGGCKVDPDRLSTKKLISKPEDWRVDSMINVFRGLCKAETSPALINDAQYFISTMSEMAKCFDHHVYEVNETANSAIMARLISFKDESRK